MMYIISFLEMARAFSDGIPDDGQLYCPLGPLQELRGSQLTGLDPKLDRGPIHPLLTPSLMARLLGEPF